MFGLTARTRFVQATLLTILALFFAPGAFAGNNCNWNLLSLLGGSWNNPSNWTSCGGGIPGQNAGDTATITLGIAVTVDAPVPNPVSVTFNTVGLVTVTVRSGGALTLANGSASTLLGNSWVINGGTLSVASGSNLASYAAHITLNSGAFNLPGSLTLANGYVQNGGTMTLGPGQFGATSIAINGGTVTGQGTLTGPVTLGAATGAAAFLQPGGSVGSITINGSYTQLPTGVLNIDIAGTTAGTQYDQLIVNGAATLAGTLQATLGGSFAPANGNIFNVVSFRSRTGDFTYNLPSIAPGSMQHNFAGSFVQLQAVFPQADIVVSQTAAPQSILHNQTASFTVTVTNNGPAVASGIAVTNTLTGGLLTGVSATTATCSGFGASCTIPSLAPGASEMITLVATPAAVGTMTNIASAFTTSAPDPNLANNSVSTPVTVNSSSDLVTVVTGPASVTAATTATFTVAVTNAGLDSVVPVVTLNISGGTLLSSTGNGLICTSAGACTGSLLSGGSTATLTVTARAQSQAGAMVLTANAGPTAGDTNASNNSASGTTTVTPLADVKVTKAAVSPLVAGTTVTYDITVANAGPSDAAAVVLSDLTPSGLALLSISGGGCSAMPCSLGTLAPASVVNITASYALAANATGTIANTATASSASTPDPNPANNAATVSASVLQSADLSVVESGPASAVAGDRVTYTITVTNNGPSDASGVQLTDPTPARLTLVSVTGACSTFPCSLGTMTPGQTTTIQVAYSVSAGPATTIINTAAVSSSTTDPNSSNNSASAQTSTSTGGCDTRSAIPTPSLFGEVASGQTYAFSYSSPAATRFEVDESTDPSFASKSTQSTTATSLQFQHVVTAPTAFYYRARAFVVCANAFSGNSVVMRVVVGPAVSPANPNISVPVGSYTPVAIPVHAPGIAGKTTPFTATLDDKPWLKSVQPSSGVLPPEGADFTVIADPTGLPNGTFTGTLLITDSSSASGRIATNGVTAVGVPVSISLVTPVTPNASFAPSANTLVIPSAGHLDGVNSHWKSDVRIANTSDQRVQYQLMFTPDDLSIGAKQTLINIDPGATTALDDIVKTWFGAGSLGESANGVVAITPLDAKGAPNGDVNVSLATIASSRTYNMASTAAAGTLGQFIPAIPFSHFVGSGDSVLSLQQIAQNDAYRTNVGVVEASGKPASVLISAFDSQGNRLLDVPMDLKGGEQRQLNAFLAQHNIVLSDGRIEVKVTNGEGKITAYASVVDNKSGDPTMVTGVPLGQNGFDHFVLPGVAALNTGNAAWRTDMRIFNPTSAPQFVTLNFYSQNSGDASQLSAMTINPGEVKELNDLMKSVFGDANAGGAVHVTTAVDTPLVVTGRTYNLTSNGTFGQFIPGATSADAIGKGDRALSILQAEDSVRYRTNVGIAEVTGKPVRVEVQVILPDSKIAPSTQIPIAANGFMQVPLIEALGLSNAYNARITMRVVDGDGKIAAYGSVIDQVTQDPTYVPAQQ